MTKKPNALDLFNTSTAIINRSASADAILNGEKFPFIFHKYRLPNGDYEIIQETAGRVMNRTTLVYVRDMYAQHVRSLGLDNLAFAPSLMKSAIDHWIIYKEDFKEHIHPVLQKSSPGACWRRLDFDMTPDMPTPTFDALLKNVKSNKDAMLAWLGAIFDPKIKLQQYLWLFGDGQNGKGTIMWLLQEFLGDAATGIETDARKTNQFAMSHMIGKRLAIADDCGHPGYVLSSTFKAATGDGSVRIEEKGKAAYYRSLDALFAFTSNKKPFINTEASNLRRAIFVEFYPSSECEYIPNLKPRLREEAPGILAKLWKAYQEGYDPSRYEIKVDMEAIRALAEDNEEQYYDLFEQYFELGSMDDKILRSEVSKTLKHLNSLEIGKFYDWLLRTHPTVKKTKHLGLRHLIGVRFKGQTVMRSF